MPGKLPIDRVRETRKVAAARPPASDPIDDSVGERNRTNRLKHA